ncbi:MAG: glycosyltransferase [bacterium]|nr:glycosyltransferase [bacterium]
MLKKELSVQSFFLGKKWQGKPLKFMKVALVYDRVNKWGGAERVLLALHELFPKAPLYTSVYHSQKAEWAEVFDVRTSFLQKFPKASSRHEAYALFMPSAFKSFSFDEYDLVISVTSDAAKGIVTNPKTKHICYCLTPTRYLWSGYDDYFRNPFFRLLSLPAVLCLRGWDKAVSKKPDYFIAISKEVQKRIKKYYGRDSKVIYPPLTINVGGPAKSFLPASAPSHIRSATTSVCAVGSLSTFVTPQNNYFLIVSRLVPYKKIDLAIGAFNKLKLSLKIIGTGSEEKKLKSMASPNIEFLGNLTDNQVVEYYRNCVALIFPSFEDFGLTILEAQSFGKPVVAFRGGGALETVIKGKTGDFFYPQTEKALFNKLKTFKPLKYCPEDCIEQASKFGKERFKEDLLSFIEEIFTKK